MATKRQDSEILDRVFHALADPTRRALLSRLSEHEHSVSELAAPFNMTLAAVSKHIRVLESAGLIRREIDGRVHRCAVNHTPLKTASALIERFQSFQKKTLL